MAWLLLAVRRRVATRRFVPVVCVLFRILWWAVHGRRWRRHHARHRWLILQAVAERRPRSSWSAWIKRKFRTASLFLHSEELLLLSLMLLGLVLGLRLLLLLLGLLLGLLVRLLLLLLLLVIQIQVRKAFDDGSQKRK